jgi:uncharacterized membrane-anchored protein
MRKVIVIIAGILVLAGVNASAWRKERLLTDGKVVLLELAPVDPRSMMQGDYMALRFKAADDAFGGRRVGEKRVPPDGRLVLSRDGRNVASFRRFDDGTPLLPGEVVIRYRIRGDVPKFATNAFFFQEGKADRYAGARFGEFRVADDGECLLTGLRDADFNVSGEKPSAGNR